tara:strand:- start:7 stop:1770 length:1764 start_codon:yes stop_codon:yes gene_type:complete
MALTRIQADSIAAGVIEAKVDIAINNLIDSAPGTLDTLNELAASLGDDADFAGTMTTSLAGKLPLAGGTMTGSITFGDNNKVNFGAGTDLQIYHDGTNSYIDDFGEGSIKLRSGTFTVSNLAGTKTSAEFNSATGQVLYYNNVVKFETTVTGISVTGDIAAVNGAYSGTGALKLPAGTTAERPTPAAGQFRYNSTEGKFEGYTDSWGEIGGGGASFQLNQFTGNSSTTAFTLTKPVEENNSLVYLDGVYQSKSHYSLSSNTLTFNTAPPTGVAIEVVGAIMALPLASTDFKLNQFSGDGSTVAFTLSAAPASENDTSVYINGVYQSKSNYAIAGTTITFSTAPPATTSVEVMAASSVVVSVAIPDDGTVTTAKIADGSVTAAKLAAGAGGAYNEFAIKTTNYTASARDQLIANKALAANTTYAVTVSGGVFHIDGVANPALTLTQGVTYTFTQSDSTNANHPIAFKDSGGNSYTTGVTSTGTPGNAGAETVFVVPANAPLAGLRYYCTVHGNGMGNVINVTTANLVITLPTSPSSGNAVFIKNAGAATVTVGRNGSNINSTADDGQLVTDAAATLVYVNSTIGWKEL